MVPYEEDSLNSPLVRLPELTSLKPGDAVTLIQPTDKNEPKAAWIVQKVDYTKRQAKLVRDSGLDAKPGVPKWICFSRIEQIFPAETAVLHLAVEQGLSVNPFIDDLGIYRDPNRLKKFMTSAVKAIAKFAATSPVPESMLITQPTDPEPPIPTPASPPPAMVMVNTSTDSESSSLFREVPDVILSSTRHQNQTLQFYSAETSSEPDSLVPEHQEGQLPRPSVSVQRNWTTGLGSFDEITTETLSDAMVNQPGIALHRLVSLPSGTIAPRARRTPTPKRRLQPTPSPKTRMKNEIKMEFTPIKGQVHVKNESVKLEPGVAQSTPKAVKAKPEPKPTVSPPTKTPARTSNRIKKPVEKLVIQHNKYTQKY